MSSDCENEWLPSSISCDTSGWPFFYGYSPIV